jgi:hypothetical protein
MAGKRRYVRDAEGKFARVGSAKTVMGRSGLQAGKQSTQPFKKRVKRKAKPTRTLVYKKGQRRRAGEAGATSRQKKKSKKTRRR